MKKVELLAPAGNLESFYAAIIAGADAVYLGGKNFGARALASNFDNEELIEAINYAHLYNRKVYITVNTLIYDSEIKNLLEYVEFLHKNNVDAIIVQDLGIINLLKQKFPNLEIHASTQINTHNEETLKILKDNGVKRVVLAREISIDEINKMNVDIEKEIFIHGALCMSYSGQCLLSSVIGGRSGNRGLCAGPCRLEYKVLEQTEDNKEKIINTDGKYLLSTKDLCTINDLEKILISNVNSLKIEGRMKSKEYVYIVTSIYRKAIDNFYKTGKINISEAEIQDLKSIFNRNFTKGFLLNEEKFNINNSFRPNHLGVTLGKVIDQNRDRIKIKLENNLRLNDGIRIIGEKDYGCNINKIYIKNKLVESANKGDIIEIYIKEKVKINSLVVKTLDYNQIKNVDEKLKNKIKIPISMKLVGKLNQKLYLNISDGINNIDVYSDLETFEAFNNSLTKERIKDQLNKLNDTPFMIKNLKIEIDNNILIPIKEINNIRRKAVSKLIEERIKKRGQVIVKNIGELKPINKCSKISINCLVKTEEQLLECFDNNVDRIYVEEKLYKKYKNKYNNLYLYQPRINKNYKNLCNENIIARELGTLKYSDKNKIITDYTLNVTNRFAIDFLNKYSVEMITLSTEFNNNNLEYLMKKLIQKNIELIIYGNFEIFISKYCILNKLYKCNKCIKDSKYYLLDRKNKKYQIIKDNYCNNILLSSKKINLLDNIDYYKNLGIKNFRLQFYNETPSEVRKILNSMRKTIN